MPGRCVGFGVERERGQRPEMLRLHGTWLKLPVPPRSVCETKPCCTLCPQDDSAFLFFVDRGGCQDRALKRSADMVVLSGSASAVGVGLRGA